MLLGKDNKMRLVDLGLVHSRRGLDGHARDEPAASGR